MSQTRLLLVRHGQTTANRDRIVQGQNDTSLTELGREMAAQVATKLGQLCGADRPPVTYVSPLTRTRTTLDCITKTLGWHLTPTVDPRLMEIHFGQLAGRPSAEIRPTIMAYKQHPERRYPGGESSNDLHQRVLAFLRDVVQDHPRQTVLAVTHFGVIETALRHYLKIPLDTPVQPDHTTVYCVQFNGSNTPQVVEK